MMWELLPIVGQSIGILVTLIAFARWAWAKHIRPFIVQQLIELQRNGGASMKDQIALIPGLKADIAQIHLAQQAKTELDTERHNANIHRFESIEKRQDDGARVLQTAFGVLPTEIKDAIRGAIGDGTS